MTTTAAHRIPEEIVRKIEILTFQLNPHPIAKILKTEFIPKFTYVTTDWDNWHERFYTLKFKILSINTYQGIRYGNSETLVLIKLVEEKFKPSTGQTIYRTHSISQIDEFPNVLSGFGFDRTFLRDCECWGVRAEGGLKLPEYLEETG